MRIVVSGFGKMRPGKGKLTSLKTARADRRVENTPAHAGLPAAGLPAGRLVGSTRLVVFDPVAEGSELPDHLGSACLLGFGAHFWAAFFITGIIGTDFRPTASFPEPYWARQHRV